MAIVVLSLLVGKSVSSSLGESVGWYNDELIELGLCFVQLCLDWDQCLMG